MRLPERDEVVDTFATDRANEPLCVTILPWRAGCNWSVSDSHGAKAPLEHLTVALSRSRIRYFGTHSHGKASVTCRAIHSSVGREVTLIVTISLRSIPTMTSTKSIRKSTVETTNRSSAAIARVSQPYPAQGGDVNIRPRNGFTL